MNLDRTDESTGKQLTHEAQQTLKELGKMISKASNNPSAVSFLPWVQLLVLTLGLVFLVNDRGQAGGIETADLKSAVKDIERVGADIDSLSDVLQEVKAALSRVDVLEERVDFMDAYHRERYAEIRAEILVDRAGWASEFRIIHTRTGNTKGEVRKLHSAVSIMAQMVPNMPRIEELKNDG